MKYIKFKTKTYHAQTHATPALNSTRFFGDNNLVTKQNISEKLHLFDNMTLLSVIKNPAKNPLFIIAIHHDI